MIHSIETPIKPRLGEACSLTRGHVDADTLTLTLHDYEYEQVEDIWTRVEQTSVLVEGTHFSLDAARGLVMLLEHDIWNTLGRWQSADRQEPLLYKGQLKAPHYIQAQFDHYAPAQVTVSVDKRSIVGDGVDALTLTANAEDGSSPVPIAAFNGDGEQFASLSVDGSRELKATLQGMYRLEANRTVLDPTWGLPVYAPAVENGSVTVEVTSA